MAHWDEMHILRGKALEMLTKRSTVMAKIVINVSYGGFGMSSEAIARYVELSGLPLKRVEPNPDWDLPHWEWPDGEWFEVWKIERDDALLVQVVEEMGERAGGSHSRLVVVELPKGTRYRIEEYDGMENVRTEASYEWRVA